MINILYTVNGLRINGISAVIMQYIALLDRQKYKVYIFTDEIAPKFLPELKKYGVTVICSNSRKKNQLRYVKELAYIIKNNHIDIIHAHGNSATLAVEMIVAKKYDVPVRIAHSHNTTCIHKYYDKFLRFPLYHSYTHGVSCGDAAGKWLFGRRPFLVLKNGLKLDNYRYNINDRYQLRKELNLENRLIFGHVGRFTEQKNHKFIIEVFEKYSKKNSNAVLILVGDGPLKNSIEKMVHEKGLESKVIFYGTTSEMKAIYSIMDIFIFPSKFEGVPLTLIEAQANGLECIISNRISKEVIKSECIKVCDIEDIEEWVSCLDNLVDYNRREVSRSNITRLKNAGFGIEQIKEALNQKGYLFTK